jgi:vacuolar-type H+-ATPase subunit B/Vma2
MCALVQGVRKVGIKAGGPSVGEAANPMHVIRTTELQTAQRRPPPSTRPSSSDDNMSFGQKIIEDPSTQVDDDRESDLHYESYSEEKEKADRQMIAEAMGRRDENYLMASHNVDINLERGKSFGRRRRKPIEHDLEKGQEEEE